MQLEQAYVLADMRKLLQSGSATEVKAEGNMRTGYKVSFEYQMQKHYLFSNTGHIRIIKKPFTLFKVLFAITKSFKIKQMPLEGN